jgi:NitT/TauT family transport system substrate-binding protein
MNARASRRQRLPAAFCGLIVVVLVSTAGASASPRSSLAPALTRIDVVASAITGSAPVFYATERGFFRAQGLDAKITILVDPTQYVPAVLSGEADFAPNSVGGLTLARSRGAPVRMVASGILHRPLAPTAFLVARKGSRISGAGDLAGKKVAIDAPNQLPHIALRRWLKRNGISEKDVEFQVIPFPQMLSPLAHGDVDAALIAEPYLTLALRQGATRVENVFRVVCPKICLLSGWLARKDQDPTLTAKFRNAIQAASVWADQEKNYSAVDAILSKYTLINRALLRTVTRSYYAQRLVPRLAQPWIDAYAEFGVIPASFPAIELVK